MAWKLTFTNIRKGYYVLGSFLKRKKGVKQWNLATSSST